MGTGRAAAILVLALAAQISGDARAAPDGGGTTAYATEDGRVTVALPAAWTCETIKPSERVLLHEHAIVPGASAPASVQVIRVPGMRNERGQIYLEREEQPGKFGVTTRGETRIDPMPHLVMDIPDGGVLQRFVWIPRILDRCGYTIFAQCAPADWDRMKDAFFAAAQSLTSTWGEWPERPAGYRVAVRDGYEYLIAPAVKPADADAVHRIVLDVEAGYAKVHGPVPKPDSNRIVVVVHAAKEDAAALCKQAAAAPYGSFAQQIEGRLFTVPPTKGGAENAAEFATALTSILHYQLYGRPDPPWLYRADSYVARQEALSGKPLPALAESQMAVVPKNVDTFNAVLASDLSGADVRRPLLVYEGLFRCGPAPYRDAFAAFLKQFAATGDAAAAQKAHLDPLDAAKLRAAAQDFAARGFKAVKGR